MTFMKGQENQILEHFLTGDSFPPFGLLNLGLLTEYPDGVPLTLEDNPGYNYLHLTANGWGFAHGGRISNVLAVTFPVATADWTQPVGGLGFVDITPGRLPSEAIGSQLVGDPVYIKEWERVTFPPFTINFIQDGREQVLPNDFAEWDEVPVQGHISNFAENVMLNHMFGRVNYPPPFPLWVGLCTAEPGDDGTNAHCNEVPLGGGYTRALADDWYVDSLPNWGAGYNGHAIEFPEATESWGTVTHFGIFDTQNPAGSGHLLIYGPIDSPWEVTIGSIPKFRAYLPPPLDDGIKIRFNY